MLTLPAALAAHVFSKMRLILCMIHFFVTTERTKIYQLVHFGLINSFLQFEYIPSESVFIDGKMDTPWFCLAVGEFA